MSDRVANNYLTRIAQLKNYCSTIERDRADMRHTLAKQRQTIKDLERKIDRMAQEIAILKEGVQHGK